MQLLSFALGNAKLPRTTAHFSLPSGFSCPFASLCLSKADRLTGKIMDGPETQFRCFSASAESFYPATRAARWRNFELAQAALRKGIFNAVEVFSASVAKLPRKTSHVRLHIAGDFFSQDYFDAWRCTAAKFPALIFYAYTKSIPFWVARWDDMPDNFRLVASMGGKHDDLIRAFNLKAAHVVFNEAQAREYHFEIDHDDSHAWSLSQESFALLLHGAQPKGSDAAKARKTLRENGIGGYQRGKGRKL